MVWQLRSVLVVSFTTRGADEILVSSVSPVDRDSCTGEEIIEAVFDSAIEEEREGEDRLEIEAEERLALEDCE